MNLSDGIASRQYTILVQKFKLEFSFWEREKREREERKRREERER